MDLGVDVLEITTGCWDILKKSPTEVMCATSRMVVKRKGADYPVVVSCTLLPYDARFELGRTLGQANGTVPLTSRLLRAILRPGRRLLLTGGDPQLAILSKHGFPVFAQTVNASKHSS
jgi:hypothetical protein